ncbi:exodeoxyribonuclease I [Aliidiomarina halalkaliphila]|uniref:Exodeoxyribonuclease I n=1 Tax=Aliidiomarina halalkaliphila TaxID=2593535 RepID=A0A552X483_9GAMM|nr:exodeoxyribonuclease I [Aliidiomarina halalkaliphila]TRW49832.1 exodeoxyribonuclease I [Aliidiomarina halalkaliphila]
MTASIYWHDYEAGGVNPRADRPMQFAGIRTDRDLNILGKPLSMYCQLSPDYLPHPQACLITGITPQTANQRGLPEVEFARRILREFSQRETTICGYNNIRYDDEMTRFMLYRNFLDPYAYSWQNDNSRWDLLTLTRAAWALRPDGVVWPENEDGRVVLKLDQLAPANGIEHSQAHDALADVYASIELAKKIKTAQPKLYDFCFDIRRKKQLSAIVDKAISGQTLLVHVSGHYGAEAGYVRWVMPLGYSPHQANQLVAWRVDCDPDQFAKMSAEEIHQLWMTPSAELGNQERPGLVTIALNQCPFLAPPMTLSDARAANFGLDRQLAETSRNQLQANAPLRDLLMQAATIQREFSDTEQDVDIALYSGGFFSQQARSHMDLISHAAPEQLAALDLPFDDPRIPQLLFRYRARNFPTTLSSPEQEKWRHFCQDRLQHGSKEFLSLEEYALEIENLAHQHEGDPNKMAILKALYQYATSL